MADRTAAMMVDLALKAVTLRLTELEAMLRHTTPARQDDLVVRIQQLRDKQKELEMRLGRLRREEHDDSLSGAVRIYPAMQEVLFFIQSG